MINSDPVPPKELPPLSEPRPTPIPQDIPPQLEPTPHTPTPNRPLDPELPAEQPERPLVND